MCKAIDSYDYKIVKSESEGSLKHSEAKLLGITNADGLINIDKLIDKTANTIARLDELYVRADTKENG